MLIEHNREKLLNAIIYFSSNTKYCGKTKLFKLLYYLDFLHFKETGRSVTGLNYFAWQFGPYPETLANELPSPKDDLKASVAINGNSGQETSFTQIKPKKKFSKTFFSKREMRILENVSYIFKEAKADDMVEASHLPNHPWDKTIKERGEKAPIDYLLALDSTESSLSLEEVMERIRDKEIIKKSFNE